MADINLVPANLTAKLSVDGELTATLSVDGELTGSLDNAIVGVYGGYSEDEVDELLKGKADKDHKHEEYLTEHQSLDHLALKEHKHDEYLTEHQDLSHLALKTEIPSLDGLASEDYVDSKFNEIPEPDLSGYALKEHEHKQYLTEHQDISGKADLTYVDEKDTVITNRIKVIQFALNTNTSNIKNKANKDHTHSYNDLTDLPDLSNLEIDTSNLATKEELLTYALKSEIPSLDGYATETFVINKISEAELGGDNGNIDLSGYVTEDELNAKGYLTQHQSLEHLALKEHEHEQYLTEHQSLDHLALKEHEHEEYLTEHQDISHLALKTDIPTLDDYVLKSELPSIEGLASQEYVDNANSEIQTQIDDLKSSVSNGKSLLASAITDMGVETLATDSWETMVDNLGQLKVGTITDFNLSEESIMINEDDATYYVYIESIQPNAVANYVIEATDTTKNSLIYELDGNKISLTVGSIKQYEKTSFIITEINTKISKTLTVEIRSSSPYYIEYTVQPLSDTDRLNASTIINSRPPSTSGNTRTTFYYYLPESYDECKIEVELNDGTIKSGTDDCFLVYVKDISKVRLYYDETLKSMRFSSRKGYNDTSDTQRTYTRNIVTVNYINTKNFTTCSDMFKDCKLLSSINLTNLKTSNVTSMSSMFYGCTSINSLDLSGFNTSNVTSMYEMFENCTGLTYLNLVNWDTSKVTSMSDMFYSVPNTCQILVSDELWTLTESGTKFKGTFTRV